MQNTLFISDLHLAPERPQIIQLFTRFIDEIAVNADTLYILGDLVEYWIGDDDRAEGLEEAFAAFSRLNNSGTEVYFMHGNRDFLVGGELARRCDFQLINDPSRIELNHQPALLMHGDTLCTDDHEYQQFRLMVRDKNWQKEFLSKTLDEREAIAKSLREKSKQATAMKAKDIMDVNQDAVINIMSENGVSLLIHGHTHRPAIHELEVNGKPAKRVVLGDWYETGSYLKISDSRIELISFP